MQGGVESPPNPVLRFLVLVLVLLSNKPHTCIKPSLMGWRKQGEGRGGERTGNAPRGEERGGGGSRASAAAPRAVAPAVASAIAVAEAGGSLGCQPALLFQPPSSTQRPSRLPTARPTATCSRKGSLWSLRSLTTKSLEAEECTTSAWKMTLLSYVTALPFLHRQAALPDNASHIAWKKRDCQRLSLAFPM